MGHPDRTQDIVWRLRGVVSKRETGLKQLTEKHARERLLKEQTLAAARAELEQAERDHPEWA